jgi:thioredoxin reductase
MSEPELDCPSVGGGTAGLTAAIRRKRGRSGADKEMLTAPG